MCSIAAYVGAREATPILVGTLRRLEHRGFDVVGVAVKNGGPTTVVRCRGSVADLEERLYAADLAGNVGIGHTRCARPCALDRDARGGRGADWASLGRPSDQNAHLHKVGPISLVYDGIVENHTSLRRRLVAAGCRFSSETDTELLVHLIHQSLVAYAVDVAQAVRIALRQVEGTYAIAVVSDVHHDRVVVARNGAPLVVGLGWGETFVASDESAIHELMNEVTVPYEGEVIELTPDGATGKWRVQSAAAGI